MVGYESVWFVVAMGFKSPLFTNVTPRHWVIGFRRFETTKGLKVQETDTTILEEEINTSGDKRPETRRYVQEETKPHVHHYESLVLSVRYNLRSVQLMPGSRPAHTNRTVHTVQWPTVTKCMACELFWSWVLLNLVLNLLQTWRRSLLLLINESIVKITNI